jgi:hypothetical protein
LVEVGGSDAGISAALRARELDLAHRIHADPEATGMRLLLDRATAIDVPGRRREHHVAAILDRTPTA